MTFFPVDYLHRMGQAPENGTQHLAKAIRTTSLGEILVLLRGRPKG